MSSADDARSAVGLRGAGTATIVVGGLAFIAALALLDWFTLPKLSRAGGRLSIVEGHGVTLWHLYTREPGILTVVAGAAVALALMSLLTRSVLAVLAPTCASFYLIGRAFPLEARDYSNFDLGFWVGNASAAAMSLGGILAVAGASRSDTSSFQRS